MRRDSGFCAKSVRYNLFTNGVPYNSTLVQLLSVDWSKVIVVN